jgi:hypothetical protein
VANVAIFCAGVLVVDGTAYKDEPEFPQRVAAGFPGWPLVVVVDNALQATRSDARFLWTTFTRFEPAADLYAERTRVVRNHLVREGTIVIYARFKPSYPDELFCDPQTAGPLLISVGPDGVGRALDTLVAAGFTEAEESQRDIDRLVAFFADELPAGSYEWVYLARATTPIGASALQPHAPFGAPLLPSAQPNGDIRCLAQRLRLTFGGESALAGDDGCGRWGGAPSGRCALDFEASYCGGGSAPRSSYTIPLTLSDAFALSGGSTSSSFVNLTVRVVDAAEPPALAWSDNATLAALAAANACPRCPAAGAGSPLEALIDDVTGAQPASGDFPVLLLCSQSNSSEGGIRFQALPVEGGAATAGWGGGAGGRRAGAGGS